MSLREICFEIRCSLRIFQKVVNFDFFRKLNFLQSFVSEEAVTLMLSMLILAIKKCFKNFDISVRFRKKSLCKSAHLQEFSKSVKLYFFSRNATFYNV